MANKKIVKIACLSLLAVLGLTGCSSDELIAKPTNYEEHIIIGENTGKTQKVDDVYNNLYKIVEKAYHDGDSYKTDVLSDVLYAYAISIFGQYNAATQKSASATDTITFKKAVKGINQSGQTWTGSADTDAFLDSHPIYQVKKADGQRDKSEEYKRLKGRWDTIEKRISKAMYEKANSDTYKDRSIFDEKKFVKSLVHDLKIINEEGDYSEKMVVPEIDKEDVWVKENDAGGLLNRVHYQKKYNLTDDEVESDAMYIEKDVIPTIYSQLLVEQYILSQTPNALGRSHARKVNILTVPKASDNENAAKNIIEAFRDRIFSKVIDKTTNTGVAVTEDDFYAYSKVIIGLEGGDKPIAAQEEGKTYGDIYKQVYGEAVQCNNYRDEKGELLSYYKGSESGKIIKEYDKITDDPNTTDSSAVSTFTNSGTYPKEFGLLLKFNEIELKDNTTKGWYIQNGGLSSLPDSIRTRLFSAGVAGAKLDGTTNPSDRCVVKGEEVTYEVPKDESAYLAYINGKYYLKTSTHSQESKPEDDIVFKDDSSGTYYIIQVEEAVNTAKFATSEGQVGGQGYSGERLAEIQSAVAQLIASTESYQTLAKKYWLKQMGLNDPTKYHDQQVYNYFKTNYKELFE